MGSQVTTDIMEYYRSSVFIICKITQPFSKFTKTVNKRKNSAVCVGLCFKYLAEINKPHFPNKGKGPHMAEGMLLDSEWLLNLLGTSHIKLNSFNTIL